MSQPNFLWQLAEKIIDLAGLGPLTEEQKDQYIPTLVALLEERIGTELMPKLNETQQEEFTTLMTDETTSPEAWQKFWYGAVPDFEEQILRIAGEFIEEGKKVA